MRRHVLVSSSKPIVPLSQHRLSALVGYVIIVRFEHQPRVTKSTGASEGLHTLLIEREAPGGQAGMSSNIENYLGFPTGLTGANLARRAVAQAARFGAEILTPQEATGIRVDDPYRFIKLNNGTEISCHTLVIATGVSYRRLDVPGIERLTGAGVYYGAAITQALPYHDEDVYMVGGANSAGQAAMYFSKYVRKVTLLVRGDSLAKSMSQYLVDQIRDKEYPSLVTFKCDRDKR